jgi:Flp pilus assembly protein TadD
MNAEIDKKSPCNRAKLAVVCRRIAVVALAATLGACASMQGSGQDNEQIRQIVEKRAKAAKAAQQEAAAASLQHGKKALTAGQYKIAYEAFIKAYKANPKNSDALFGMAESLLGLGEAAKASSAFAKVTAIPEMKNLGLQGRGLALAMLGRNSAAEKYLRTAAEGDPALWRAWNGIGKIEDAKGQWEDAAASYDKALKANPKAAVVYNNRGVSRLIRHDYDGAAKDFRQALGIDPELQPARGNLRVALGWQGKYVEALVGVTPKEAPAVLNNMGYIAMKRGDYEGAEAYLAQAMQLSPAYYAKAAENLAYLRQIRKIEEVAPKKKKKG